MSQSLITWRDVLIIYASWATRFLVVGATAAIALALMETILGHRLPGLRLISTAIAVPIQIWALRSALSRTYSRFTVGVKRH
jgi:uncharacterized membrane protein